MWVYAQYLRLRMGTARSRPSLRLTLEYKARNSATVKLVTKPSQWFKIGMRGRRKGRGASNLRNGSFAGNLEWQSFV
ncbi:hypothetical protein EVAR_102966_1 [Eumeta japonica]|uniref:Uncharacterized protein n=1 Tax=Eumeta variegata TaxID=151549 RepID=A0A4C1UPJ3_EUMVA|nr:hypothetical protein EVAR_102966_1 [Eumeta japonica]